MMKKLLSSILVLILLLSGCSSSSNHSGSNLNSDKATGNVNVNSEEPRHITKEEVFNLLDRRLSKNGYPSLTMALHSQLRQDFDGVSRICDLYIPSSGMYFYFISDKNDGTLYQFTFIANSNEILTVAKGLQSYIEGTLPFIFEPDTWESLSSQLKMGSTSKGLFSASSDTMEYSYERTENVIKFNAYLIGKEMIYPEALDFENGIITPQKDHWSVFNFIYDLRKCDDGNFMNFLNDAQPVAVGESDLKGLSLDIREGAYYSLGSGVRMYLFTSDQGRLERVEFIALFDWVTTDSLINFGYTTAKAVKLFDEAQSSDILDTIRIDDFGYEDSRIAVGGTMNYLYKVSKDSIGLFISRNSPIVYLNKDIEAEREYLEGPLRFEGCLYSGVTPTNPSTSFWPGSRIWLQGRICGLRSKEDFTLTCHFPNGTTDTINRYGATAGDDLDFGWELDFSALDPASYGSGRLTITMDSTSQTIATFPFTIDKVH